MRLAKLGVRRFAGISAFSSPHDSMAWVRFVDHVVHIRLSNEATQTLLSELERSPHGGIKSSLALMREVRPSSHSQALWFWEWLEHRGAG